MPIHSTQAYHPANVQIFDLRSIHWDARGHEFTQGADPRCHLMAIVSIGGADFHLEAIEVEEIDGMQCGADGAEEMFHDFELWTGRDGRFETVSIEGRSYCLVMTPFCK